MSDLKVPVGALTTTASRYAPPYDSPIEDIFAYTLDKYLHPSAKVTPQFEVATRAGVFRLDFVLEWGPTPLRVGVECDGKEFHEPYRDEWRDANIFAARGVDRLYRFSGSDLYNEVNHCLGLMMLFEPFLFSKGGITNLETLLSDDLPYFEKSEYETQRLGPIKAARKVYVDPSSPRAPFWTRYLIFALANPPMPLDAMMAAWKAKQDKDCDF